MAKTIQRREIPNDLTPIEGIPIFLSKIYQARGIRTQEELELGLSGLERPNQLKGLDRALDILEDCLRHDLKVLIVGDFDADGATSTALAVHSLRAMGLSHCDYLVPNRFDFGYGLSPEIVEYAAQQNPDVLVTVDNGISSVEGVEKAHSLGMRVIVTDHHLPGDDLPNADAIVNPNQPDCPFISKNSAGVGVIFYVLNALKSRLKDNGWFEARKINDVNMANYLDLVALGTVADLVPLDRNNRILVEQGLRRIRAGRCRPGILAILNVAQKKHTQINATDIGFIIGPRLNAAGRLEDMSLGIECLLAEDALTAATYAERLDSLNRERKTIEEEMKRDAENHLSQFADEQVGNAWGISLYEPHWHQGVIGILASRIKERLHRPVVIFAPESDNPEEQDPVLKGSARSIPGFHMRDGLDLVAKRFPGVLIKFGGHAMAAGMTIRYSQLAVFQKAFDDVVRSVLSESDLEMTYQTDGELAVTDLTIEPVELLKRSGPWGQRFPEPSFDGNFRVVSHRILKDKHLKLVLMHGDTDQLFDAIQFNSDWVKEVIPERIRVVYRPDINEFRGRRSVQLMLDHVEASA